VRLKDLASAALLLVAPATGVLAQTQVPVEQPTAPPPLESVMAAAFEGDALSQLALALMYEQRESFTNAHRWLRRAAEGGIAEAQFKLGYSLTVGLGAPTNLTEAAKWYRAAATQNHAEAQYNLAVCLEKGLGVKADLQEAFAWHSKAALLGDDFAQKALGVCYEKGRGTTADPAEAFKWYQVAANRGNPDAARLLKLLEPRLTKTQREDGQRRVTDFLAKAPASATLPIASKPEEPRKRAVDFLE